MYGSLAAWSITKHRKYQVEIFKLMRGACRHVYTCSNAPRVLWGQSHGHYKSKTSSIPPRERHFDQNCPILVLQRGGERGCKTALFRQLSRPRGGNNGREAFLSCLGGLPWLPSPWGGLVWPSWGPMGSPLGPFWPILALVILFSRQLHIFLKIFPPYRSYAVQIGAMEVLSQI